MLVLNAFRRHGRIHAPLPFPLLIRDLMCSTPFGVMVGFTHRGRLDCAGTSLCSTPFGVMVGFTVCRLVSFASASKVGAQRLSASWSDSHGYWEPEPCESAVLNAFRRHGRIHGSSTSRSGLKPRVLNAFRRHGRIHAGSWSRNRHGRQVLNAFRRHGRIH